VVVGVLVLAAGWVGGSSWPAVGFILNAPLLFFTLRTTEWASPPGHESKTAEEQKEAHAR
jgi:hypothetical protein